MKIQKNKEVWQIESKNSLVSFDPLSDISKKKIFKQIILNSKKKKANKNNSDFFLIENEGRYELKDFFIESFYVGLNKEQLSFYIIVENVKILYLGENFNVKGDDSVKNLGKVEVLIIRPEETTDLERINTVVGHYSPFLVLILTDKYKDINKLCNHFGKEKEEIEEGFNLKQKSINQDSEIAEYVLIS